MVQAHSQSISADSDKKSPFQVVSPALKNSQRGIFFGLSLVVFGAIWIFQLSPVEWYTAQPLIPRLVYEPLLLLVGGVIMLGSVLGGQRWWPRRPRYAGIGVLLGCWVAYPGLSTFGIYTGNNPLGYLIVFTLAIALCYVLWRDAIHSDPIRSTPFCLYDE